ncbi:hypothetical protein [Sanguibacter antarcticus]|uniref:Uncharacterized protein n=1 Tax=Sanguibacter antarcticus TaxID=372484 RepID=A0A2A9E5Q8_9MICO|nr:hypothetical protein [Sanguibacter antarcticus]PFG33695.1 hypothetical protein ATL42_1582 [Sanguibacter antarcticus]
MQSKGVLVLWGVGTMIVMGALTFALLTYLGRDAPVASGVVVGASADEPSDEALDDLGSQGSTDEPTVAPPLVVESVLADGVGFYAVQAYSLTRISDLSMSIGKDDVLVTDGVYQAVLGPEVLDASQVYDVDLRDEAAEDLTDDAVSITEPSWTVYVRFNDAAALKAATADLGCHESPENMIAMVSGTDLLRLVALPEAYCGDGFSRGQMLFLTFYGEDDVTSAEAEAQARELAATLLGDEG